MLRSGTMLLAGSRLSTRSAGFARGLPRWATAANGFGVMRASPMLLVEPLGVLGTQRRGFSDRPRGPLVIRSRVVRRDGSAGGSAAGQDGDFQTNEPEGTRRSGTGVAAAGAGVLGTLVLLGGKAKYVLVALKLTKLPTVLSMVASSGAYAFVYGWPFALTMMGHLVVHESGHALMMRYYGYPFSPMVFIPFMGAVVGQGAPSRNATEEGNIALAGPALGGLLSLGLTGAGLASGSQFLLAAADFGYMINLFNLMPVIPLDGGRAASVLSPWIVASGSVGMIGLVGSGIITSPMGYMITFLSVYGTYQRFFGDREDFHNRTTPREKMRIGMSYASLVAILMMGMAYNSKFKKSPAQLRKEQGTQPKSALEKQLVDFSQEHGEELEQGDPWLNKRR